MYDGSTNISTGGSQIPVATGDLVGQRSETVRRANLSAIIRELHSRGPLSRSELVARTGLTRSAIRALIGEFVEDGIVVEGRPAPVGVPGRPSPLVQPKADGIVVLALEITVDSLAVAIIGLGGEVIEHIRVDQPRGHSSVDEIVADLSTLTRRLVALDRLRAGGSLAAIGVAIAGLVDRRDGRVATAPNIGWLDVPLGERLAVALNLGVPISVANEADLGALAELRRGAGRGADNLLFIFGEVGVGGGIIIEGKPLTGVAGYAGEVGHMPVNREGRRCRCGSTGCWETEIGERALLTRAGRKPDGGRNAVDAVIREVAAGSPVAVAAAEGVGTWLGIGLASLVNVLNPRLVILGGLFERLFPYLLPAVSIELNRTTLVAPLSLVHVVPAELGMDAPLIGAAELAFEAFLSDPAAWLGRRSEERRVVA